MAYQNIDNMGLRNSWSSISCGDITGFKHYELGNCGLDYLNNKSLERPDMAGTYVLHSAIYRAYFNTFNSCAEWLYHMVSGADRSRICIGRKLEYTARSFGIDIH